jgi:hypothetical protein
LHNTCVCATMLPLDDSDGIPEWFLTASGKKEQECVPSSTENSVGIAMVKKLATNSIWGDEKGANRLTIPTFLDPNVLWKNLCGISSSAILPTENVVIPTSNDYYNIILTAATRMREDDNYKSRRGLVVCLILLLCVIDPNVVTHYIFKSVWQYDWVSPWKDSHT